MTTDLALLHQIAARIDAMPHGSFPYVKLGCDSREAFELLARQPDATRRATVHAPGHGSPIAFVIEAAELVVDGVIFAAQFDRPATTDEAALLDTNAAEKTEKVFLSVSLGGSR